MKKYTTKQIVQYVLIFSVILYFAGIYTGININRVLNVQVEREIDEIKSFLDTSSLDIKNIILNDFYIQNFNHNNCKLMELQLDHLRKGLPNFWSELPERLEDYEIKHEVDDEYFSIKREYFRFSLRFWLLNTNFKEKCEIEHNKGVLYFYTNDCPECLNSVQLIEDLNDPEILILPIQSDFEDDTIYLLKEFYNISIHPTFIYKYEKFEDVEDLIPKLNN